MGHSWREKEGGELERERGGRRFIVGERGEGGLKLVRERGRRVELGREKGGGGQSWRGRERGKEFQSWGEREGGIIDGREGGS